VVVTGIGLVTPLGIGRDTNWTALMAGKSGIGPITRFDPTPLPSRVAGEVRGFEPREFIEHRDVKKMDIFIQYAVAAARLAVRDAELVLPVAAPERMGVVVGVGMGGIATLEEHLDAIVTRNIKKISPFFLPRLIPNMAAGHIAIDLGARGPNYAVASACASGAHALGESLRLIRADRQDVMVAGGTEAPICLFGVGGFCAMRALATNFNHEPTRASRPFDRGRDGFVIAEGAGVLVLEELEHARGRGATCYAEIVGYGANCDAYHMTSPPPEGDGAAVCMSLALQDAGLTPQDIQYVNAHGTGTPAGDTAETSAVHRVFGERTDVAVSSTKSMTGHLLGAAGAVEAAYTVLAIKHGMLPPTINLEDPDPSCDLDAVPLTARPARISAAMSNSFGFGGTNVSLVFRGLD
jgi:3-oxoacyl-[acyl-carrier-protein] synthase II